MLPQPGVLRGVCEVARVGVGRRPVDVLEVDGRLACDGVLRVARWRGVPDSLPDVALVAGDQPADEDGNLVSRRSVARLDKQPTARMLARERVVQRGVLLEDVPWDVLVAQRPPLAVLGVLLAGHRDQVGRYRLDPLHRACPPRSRLAAGLLDDALPVVEELPEPVQSDDGGKDPIRFELVQPCQESAEQRLVKGSHRDGHGPMLRCSLAAVADSASSVSVPPDGGKTPELMRIPEHTKGASPLSPQTRVMGASRAAQMAPQGMTSIGDQHQVVAAVDSRGLLRVRACWRRSG